MLGTVGFVSKSNLQKYKGKWDSRYSFSSYCPFFKPEVTHLLPIIALNSCFRLKKQKTKKKNNKYTYEHMPEKVNSSGTGSDGIIILTSS